MRLRIAATKNGYRRAGVAHSTTPVIHDARAFTDEQIALLKADPLLIVDELPDEPAAPKKSTDGKTDPKGDAKGDAKGDPKGDGK